MTFPIIKIETPLRGESISSKKHTYLLYTKYLEKEEAFSKYF